jgi:predicted DCC family thiol-disulfide oxidoreductase YuxK
MEFHNDQKIIFFDGYCGLCNKSVDWIMTHDSLHIFNFAPLQGKTAEKFNLFKGGSNSLKTLIYFNGTELTSHSSAVLLITKELPNPWKLLYIFIIIPSPIRDFFYKIISKYRYTWFGKNGSCRLPLPHERPFFLD